MGTVYESHSLSNIESSSDNTSGSISNAGVFGTRGPIIFTESGTFNIADYGLKIGDKVNVICVGGGGAGCGAADYASGSYITYSTYYYGGDAGTNGGYGSGGNGASCSSNGNSTTSGVCGSGGGSGYVTQDTVVINTNLITVTIGAGGKGKNTVSTANSGGSTSFGTLLTADGGRGGSLDTGGAGGNKGSAAGSRTGGAGGAGFNITGTFCISTQESPNIQGDGVCFIWY
jgi:hypothetical protein